MKQKFSNNRLDLQMLWEFCEQEDEEIDYRKGDQLEHEVIWYGGMLQVYEPWHQLWQRTYYMALVRG